MKEMIDELKEKLSSKAFAKNLLFTEIKGYNCIEIPPIDLVEVCSCLKNDFGFNLLTDIAGIDRFTKDNRFELMYNLWSIEKKQRIFLRVKLNSNKPEAPTVSSVWQTADWEEREAYDMYGIIFSGHPDLRRIYMRDDFEYFPLRKDYPLMGLPGAVELPKK
ncbi:MAG: NADH-quinone oxidoreductase subunit C [Ignavibacteria bacterium]|jgi:NADH-quinone oxidoreductase subunit C